MHDCNRDTMQILSAGRTDPGNIRTNNEDALLVNDEHGLYAVAAGIGGHASGGVASRLAIEALSELLRRETASHTNRNSTHAAAVEPDAGELPSVLLSPARLLHANTVIRESVKQDPALSGMGTTLTIRLCTDWLTEPVNDEEMARGLQERTPAAAIGLSDRACEDPWWNGQHRW
jgi:serine/threonine protein phosphatase PrpC